MCSSLSTPQLNFPFFCITDTENFMTISQIVNNHKLPVDIKLRSDTVSEDKGNENQDSSSEDKEHKTQDPDKDQAKNEQAENVKTEETKDACVKDTKQTDIGNKDKKEALVALREATVICEYTHLYLVACAITHRK